MTVPRYNTCTIWSVGVEDPRTGKKTNGTPRTYKCSLKRGGSTKLVDSTGSEFHPRSTFWVRESDLVSGIHSEPIEGETIVKGDQIASTPQDSGAEIIRGVVVHDHAKWSALDSYTIGTSA